MKFFKFVLGMSLLAGLTACNPDSNKATQATGAAETSGPAVEETVSDAAADLIAGKANATPVKKAWSANIIKTEKGYQVGNPQAKTTLVEYGARTCPACASFHKQAKEDLLKNYVNTGKVKYEYRNYMIHGLPDIAATLAAECAGPDKFFPILDEMYARQKVSMETLQKETNKARADLKKKDVMQVVAWIGEKAGYIEILKMNGVAEDKVRQCLLNKDRAQQLVNMTKAAQDVKGTPAFYLDGTALSDYQWADIKKKIDDKTK